MNDKSRTIHNSFSLVLLGALVFLVVLNSIGCPDTILLTEVKHTVWPKVAAPQFSPSAGVYSSDQAVTISAADRAIIYFTTDGSEPSTSSSVFESPISVSGHGTVMTIKAFATKERMNDSTVVSATFTVDYYKVATPQFDPAGGTHQNDITVAITCSTPDTTIYYTMGTASVENPTTSSPIYNNAIPVAGNGTEMTIKALAVKTGMLDSEVGLADYSIKYPGDINVKQGSLDILSNGTANFGSVVINTLNDVTFTIENLGTGSLGLTGDPNKVLRAGTDATLYEIVAQPATETIAPGDSSIFTIRFTASLGYREADITIPSDDPDESPYLFKVVGTGIVAWAGPPKTGQVTTYLAGDDGDLEKGVAWPSTRFTDNSDGTITDNLTGLMWEKSPSSILRNWENAVSAPTYLTLGGHSDWRLPNVIELESLISSAASNPESWLNSQGFSNIQSGYYWTSTTYAFNTIMAWVVTTSHGQVTYTRKDDDGGTYTWSVRVAGAGAITLARTGQLTIYGYLDDGTTTRGISWPIPRFVDNGNSTITDKLTGLMWEKNPSIEASAWADALAYANDLHLAGYLDWRLPNRKELWSLLNFGSSDTAAWLNTQGFAGLQSDYYWSSTTYAPDVTRASIVGLQHGYIGYGNKPLDPIFFWAVRGGP